MSVDLRKVKKLIELVEESGISELEVRDGDETIRIARQLGQPAMVAAPAAGGAPAAAGGAPAAAGGAPAAAGGAPAAAGGAPAAAGGAPAATTKEPAAAGGAPAAAGGAPAATTKAPAAAGGEPAATNKAPAAATNEFQVRSPMAGTFYRAPTPDAQPFVVQGQSVSAGDVLCIVESMKMMNEIKAERGGVCVGVLVENGEAIGSGQLLFRFE